MCVHYGGRVTEPLPSTSYRANAASVSALTNELLGAATATATGAASDADEITAVAAARKSLSVSRARGPGTSPQAGSSCARAPPRT
eukprot:COSAG01_NODE_4258_length_5201_cov_4.634065_4_plen_86_part_00